jgi:leader peptidase (prepilin peptidase)/N-methyltransferase
VVLGWGDLATLAVAALRAVVVAAAFFGLRQAYAGLRRRHGIGLGDVKLAAIAGIWLDWWMLPIAIEIAALSALAIYALRRHVLRHRLRPTSRLPFGLFFAPAVWIGWLLQTAVPSGW